MERKTADIFVTAGFTGQAEVLVVNKQKKRFLFEIIEEDSDLLAPVFPPIPSLKSFYKKHRIIYIDWIEYLETSLHSIFNKP